MQTQSEETTRTYKKNDSAMPREFRDLLIQLLG